MAKDKIPAKKLGRPAKKGPVFLAAAKKTRAKKTVADNVPAVSPLPWAPEKPTITHIPVAKIAVLHPVAPIEIAVHDPNVFDRVLNWIDKKMKL